jgi:group I intron endonuclease
MKGSCIYIIRNFIDDRVYIGSTADMVGRYGNHKRQLKKGEHTNSHLQNFVNKYGFGSIYFDVLEPCDPAKLIEREQHYIDTFKPQFNMNLFAQSVLGICKKPKTEEHKRKLSEALKGRKLTPDMCAKISEGQMGRKWSEASKRKASESAKGKKKNPEAVEKMRQTKTGVKQSPEMIAKRMEALLPVLKSEEYRLKKSEATKKQWERTRLNEN